MIFNKLTLKNFGVFKGVHEFDLKPKTKDKPIILFGGMNGAGKTTILDAMQLVLYGKFAKCSNRGNIAYDTFLAQTVNHHTPADDTTSLTLEFQVINDDSPMTVHISREWSIKDSKLVEVFTVRINGEVNIVITENWLDFIDNHLPRSISSLFFFDGEKIEELSNHKKSSKIIETAMVSLLGLDHVNQLSVDLKTVNRQRSVDKLNSENKEIESLEGLITALEDELNQSIQVKGETASRLDILSGKLRRVEEKYKQQGGGLYDERESIKQKRDHAIKNLQANKEGIKNFVSGDSPIALVQDLIQQAQETAVEEEITISNREVLKTLEERDNAIISKLKTINESEDFTRAIKELFSEDIKNREKTTENDIFLKVPSDTFKNFDQQFFNEISKQSNKLRNEYKKSKLELDQLEEKVSMTPSDSKIAKILRELKECETEVSNTRKTLEEKEIITGQISLKLKLQKEKLETCFLKLNESQIKEFQNKRILNHSEKIQKTLKRYKSELISKNITFLQTEISTCFKALIGKEDLIDQVVINHKSYDLSLVKKNGTNLNVTKLSAGERQLLAVSVLWGLAKASNRNIPTIIDSPLGRLDVEHRTNLIENYFPFASDQVIIFSTDTEINGQHLNALSKNISHEYHISYSEAEQSSKVSKGYFQ